MAPARRMTWAALLVLAAGLLAACNEQGDVKVLSLTFSGNSALTHADLVAVLATKSSGWLPWSTKRYFNRQEFEADLNRVVRAYADAGYAHARVTDVKLTFNDKKDGVHIRLTIDEGRPTIVDRVVLDGFDNLPPESRATIASLPLKAGQPRSQKLALESRELAQRAWRDRGYPVAAVTLSEEPAAADHVVVTLTAVPGARAFFGDVTVVGNAHVNPSVVHRTITFSPGQLYSERALVESQRRLQSLSVFRLADIDAKAAPEASADRVPVTVTVKEAPPQRLQLRGGYGSEEKVRVGVDWSHMNLFGGAETASAGAKWSSLERAVRASFGQPAFFMHTSLDLTAEVASSDEPAFTSRNSGGRVTLSKKLGTQSDIRGTSGGDLKIVYTREFLAYQIKSDSLANLTLRTQLIALGLNPDTGKGAGTLGSIAVEIGHHTTDKTVDPTRGSLLVARVEHASPSLGGTFQYDELSGEARHYISFGHALRWAARARFGTILAQDDADVPFSGRYFLGGSTTLRGWGLYEVSPLGSTGETIGGRTRLDLSSEWEVDLTSKLAGVLFVDAGNVWAGDWDFHFNDLRYDAGPGLRYKTPVGSLRLDVGFQINPITGLVVNGQPSTRRWRIHFGIGEAF